MFPALRNLLTIRRNPLAFFLRTAEEQGDIGYFALGTQKVFLLNHPDYIQDVLVTHNRRFMKGRGLQRAKRLLGEGLLTSEGEFHLRQRRLSQPAFHRQRIMGYGETMTRFSANLRDTWQAGETIEVDRAMMHLTLAIAAKTLFNADVGSEADEIGAALTTAFGLFSTITLPFSKFLERLPLPQNRRFQQARERLDSTIYRIIDEHRASETDNGDLLSMLLLAQDTEGDGGSMTDEQVRDEAMTIFLAGHETTANALTWTWYLLSQHPEVEERLHREIESVLGNRLPTAEDVPNLRYTEMVFSEAMRLYPPAWLLGRMALEDHQINGQKIPRRSLVLMSQYVTHHDERWYPDPYRFDPERWRTGEKEKRPRFSYFPFGGGPRLCIGESFAWMEGALVIATIAQRWRLRLAPEQEIDLMPLVTLRPRFGMKMIPEAR
ncbi:MAG: cytochrome P450 [Acidobacteriota bacterium]